MSNNLTKAIKHNFYAEEYGPADHMPHVLSDDSNADPEAVHDYETIQNSPSERHQELRFFEGSMPKALYKSKDTGRKYLVKAYHSSPIGGFLPVGDGFVESLASSLYKAGNIHHLLHKTHVSMGKDHRGDQVPLLVVHMEPHAVDANAVAGHLTDAEMHAMHPDKMRVEAMDYILGNTDRHAANTMFHINPNSGRPTGILAIDNGGMSYSPISKLYPFDARGFETAGFNRAHNQIHADGFTKWWRERSPFIRLAFHQQIPQMADDTLRDHITQNFDDRCSHLDRIAEHFKTTGQWKTTV